jgi:hypothetical protein
VNVCSFLSEVLNVQPTTSTVLAFGPDIAPPLLAQARGGAVTIHYALAGPFLALLAGILILIVPRILNYIVAIYLILIGLIGIVGR